MVVGFGYPVVWQFVTSFQEFGLAQQFGQPPVFTGLRNYVGVFTEGRALAVLARSIIFCLVNSSLIMVLGFGIAQVMRAVYGPVRVVLQVSMVLAWATPVITSVTIFRWLFDNRTGLVNWVLRQVGVSPPHGGAWLSSVGTFFVVATVVVTWMSVPFVALSLYSALTQVDTDCVDAARIDGAGSAQITRHIILPSIRPVLTIVVLLQLVWNLRVFAQIRLLQDAGAPVSQTDLLGNFIFDLGMGRNDFGGSAAVSVLVLVVTTILTAPYVRRMMRDDAP
jgi:N,N'-diacetylchitobiose transport system permease protein